MSGAAAEKKFDATLADADLVQIVLKGNKAEKQPNMPGYEEKGKPKTKPSRWWPTSNR